MRPAPISSNWRWTLIIIALCGSIAYGFVFGRSYSDLHPIWTATHAALHGGDPYSSALADQERVRFHAAVIGNTPYDLRFAYPFPSIFLFAPLALFSFEHARVAYTVIGLLLTVLSVKWWTGEFRLDVVLLVLASRPVMLGISSQQPTVLFAALLAAAFACMRSQRSVTAGVLLGLVVAKPQLLLFVAAPVCIWVLQDWRKRRALPLAFIATSAALTLAAFALQPHWFSGWLVAVRAYSAYAGDSIPMLLFGHRIGLAVSVVLAVIGTLAIWRLRSQLTEVLAVSITTALAVLPFQPYNAMLLIPPAVLLFHKASGKPSLPELISRLSLIEMWAFPVVAILIELRFSSTGPFLYRIEAGLMEVVVFAVLAAIWERSYIKSPEQAIAPSSTRSSDIPSSPPEQGTLDWQTIP